MFVLFLEGSIHLPKVNLSECVVITLNVLITEHGLVRTGFASLAPCDVFVKWQPVCSVQTLCMSSRSDMRRPVGAEPQPEECPGDSAPPAY